MVTRRFEVYLTSLDLAVGAEMQKTRPCVIDSPDQMNNALLTVMVAPLTGVRRPFPFRVDTTFGRKPGQLALDQIRAIDKRRLVKRLGRLDAPTARRVLRTLQEMFA